MLSILRILHNMPVSKRFVDLIRILNNCSYKLYVSGSNVIHPQMLDVSTMDFIYA